MDNIYDDTRLFPVSGQRLSRVCFISEPGIDVPEAVVDVADAVEHLVISKIGDHVRIETQHLGHGSRTGSSQDFSLSDGSSPELMLLSAMRRLAGDGVVIYHHSANIFEHVRCAIPISGIPYVIVFDEPMQFPWTHFYFLSGARARICLNEDALRAYKSLYLYDVDAPSEGELENIIRQAARRDRYTPSTDTAFGTRRILLVSYFMPPAETVAVHRIDYWHNMLPEIARDFGETAVVDTVTACQSPINDERFIVVPDLGECAPLSERAEDIIARSREARVNRFGVCWGSHVENYFRQNPSIRYDAVVISGNPFFYFTLAEYFRNAWGAKIILDFRDPFANNPRFTYTPLHKQLVCELEDEFLANADHAISVNTYCVDALRLLDERDGSVVANGFDERVVDVIPAKPRRDSSDGRIHFVYTGSLYADRDPEPFLKALNPKTHALVHIGRTRDTDAHLDEYDAMERYGLMPYEDVIGYCRSMDAGIIFTSGAAFEQTTKIFDYIATGLDIVIVTEGEPYTGELHNLTRELDNVYWLRNRPSEIKNFLKSYTPSGGSKRGGERFSRRYQSSRLYELIRSDDTANLDDSNFTNLPVG